MATRPNAQTTAPVNLSQIASNSFIISPSVLHVDLPPMRFVLCRKSERNPHRGFERQDFETRQPPQYLPHSQFTYRHRAGFPEAAIRNFKVADGLACPCGRLGLFQSLNPPKKESSITKIVTTFGPITDVLTGGAEVDSTYTRLIQHYAADGTTLLHTLSDGASDSRVSNASFELLRYGGCGSGELVVGDPFTTQDFAVGQHIKMSYKTGEPWYFGRIEEVDNQHVSGVVLRLYGLWSYVSELPIGGSGNVFALSSGGDFTDRLPHLYALSDWYVNDPDRSYQSWDTVSNYVDLLTQIYNQYVGPYVPTVSLGPIQDPDPTNLYDFESMVFRGEEGVGQIVRSIAVMMKNCSYGVDENSRFFVASLPQSTGLEFQAGVNVRNLHVTTDRSLLFTRILLTGDYIYGANNNVGFHRYRATIPNVPGIALYGDRKVAIALPWIRTDAQAYDFARSFFNMYSQPTKRVTFTTGAQSVLIQPWFIKCRVLDESGATIIDDVISSVQCTFNAAPTFQVTVGQEDLMFPEPPEPQRWEVGDPGDNGDNAKGPGQQPTTDPNPLLTSTGGGGHRCPAQNARFGVTLFGPPVDGAFGMTWVLPGGTVVLTRIAYDVTAADFQAILEAEAPIGSGNVLVTGGPGNTTNFHVEFIGALGETAIPQPTIDTSALVPGAYSGGLTWVLRTGRPA